MAAPTYGGPSPTVKGSSSVLASEKRKQSVKFPREGVPTLKILGVVKTSFLNVLCKKWNLEKRVGRNPTYSPTEPPIIRIGPCQLSSAPFRDKMVTRAPGSYAEKSSILGWGPVNHMVFSSTYNQLNFKLSTCVSGFFGQTLQTARQKRAIIIYYYLLQPKT